MTYIHGACHAENYKKGHCILFRKVKEQQSNKQKNQQIFVKSISFSPSYKENVSFKTKNYKTEQKVTQYIIFRTIY